MIVVPVETGERIGYYEVTRAHIALPVVRSGTQELRLRLLSPKPSDIVTRFIDENRALREMQVPELGVVDVGTTAHRGTAAGTMAYVIYRCSGKARSLEEYLLRGPLAVEDASEIARRVASALSTAHVGKLVHGCVSPETVIIDPRDGGDDIRLIDFGRAHTAAPTRDPVADARGLGNLLFAMLTGTAGAERSGLDGWIDRLLGPRPPSLQELAGALGDPRPLSLERGAYRPTDRTELALVQQLEASSDDTRLVYADWLEEHGDAERALFIRYEAELSELQRVDLARRTPSGWRTTVARAPVARCVTFGPSCTKRWDAMSRTEHLDIRHCGACDQPIYYVRSLDEAAYRGQRRECIAIDAALVTATASAVYDNATDEEDGPTGETPMWVGEVAMAPEPPSAPPVWVGLVAPPPPPAKPPMVEPVDEPAQGVLDRIRSWFRRR